jgi:hypothetical protein
MSPLDATETAAALAAQPRKHAPRRAIRWRWVSVVLLGYLYYVFTVILMGYGLRSLWGALAQ